MRVLILLLSLSGLSRTVIAAQTNSGKLTAAGRGIYTNTRPSISAYRDPNTSYKEYLHNTTNTETNTKSNNQSNTTTNLDKSHHVLDDTGREGKSAEALSAKYGSVALGPATAWDSQATLLENFRRMRDPRFISDSEHPDFLRRISWLYPDDGCFARAALAIYNLNAIGAPAPNKIFVFGNLSVETTNASTGSVSWWFHVGPVVEVKGQKYVLDPAIEPRYPLKLEDWLAHMTGDIHSVDVAICGSGSYDATDICDKPVDGIEQQAFIDTAHFLSIEWDRMVELARNPVDELGDKPPWNPGGM